MGSLYVLQDGELTTAPPVQKTLPEKPGYLFRLTLGLHPDIGDDRTVTLILPAILDGKVFAVRVLRWYDANKRGYAGSSSDANSALKTTWCYNWDASNPIWKDREYVVHHHLAGELRGNNDLTTRFYLGATADLADHAIHIYNVYATFTCVLREAACGIEIVADALSTLIADRVGIHHGTIDLHRRCV